MVGAEVPLDVAEPGAHRAPCGCQCPGLQASESLGQVQHLLRCWAEMGRLLTTNEMTQYLVSGDTICGPTLQFFALSPEINYIPARSLGQFLSRSCSPHPGTITLRHPVTPPQLPHAVAVTLGPHTPPSGSASSLGASNSASLPNLTPCFWSRLAPTQKPLRSYRPRLGQGLVSRSSVYAKPPPRGEPWRV